MNLDCRLVPRAGNDGSFEERLAMTTRSLVALPVFNEVQHVEPVLDEVRRYSENILVVDDGSTDGTGDLLRERDDIVVLSHRQNRGYGAGLRSAFRYAEDHDFDYIVTIDCDGQHEPRRIPRFLKAVQNVDIVSGSRYLKQFRGDSTPPTQRRHINQLLTAELNRLLGLQLTDAFCGFKAYRVSALKRLSLTEDGYAMPLELWVQAVAAGLKIIEVPVPLIYLEEARSFGGSLDDATTRLQYYRTVLERSLRSAGIQLPSQPTACGGNAG
jgi:dolichol-phosphate mannosyltransferase